MALASSTSLPRYNMTNYGRRALSYAGSHAWNLLPENLRKSTSIAIFKRSLKTFFIWADYVFSALETIFRLICYRSVLSDSNSNSTENVFRPSLKIILLFEQHYCSVLSALEVYTTMRCINPRFAFPCWHPEKW